MSIDNHTTEMATAREQTLRTLTLDDIQALAHGESIPRFVGKIKKVWDQKSGVGEYGDWYLQNLIVESEDGDLQITWTGPDKFEPAEWEGATVAFECTEGKMGRLVGLARDIRSKDGKVYKGAKLTPAGKVLVIGAAPTRAERAAEKAEEIQDAYSPEQIEAHAQRAKAVFLSAWEKADDLIIWLLPKDQPLTNAERYDLQMRIAQGLAIAIDKAIRKERY